MTNYYELLEVANTASVEVIRAAYKAGVKRYHPDNYPDAKDKDRATERLKLLNEGLEILTDETRRARYDEELADETSFFAGGKQHQERHTAGQKENSSGTNSSRSGYANPQSSSASGGNSGKSGSPERKARVENLIAQCKNEAEYLDLRNQILKGSAAETEKLQMLVILDELTRERLQEELMSEGNLEHYREEVKSLKRGIAVWLVIGFFLSAKFAWAFFAAIILSIIAYCAGKDDRTNLARAEYAARHISIYRMRGFKI